MIDGIGTVCIFVADQDKAKEFYTQTLGFELRADQPMGEGVGRWLAVAPPGTKTEIILYLPDANWEHYRPVVGQSQAVSFSTPDLAALHADLLAKGATIAVPPATEEWGTFMMVADPDGTRLLVVQSA
jgi:catechol 2,3-dioxygenase-like lactoylglutathione lyase family enzyme